jgi:L-cysteine/cystine lyase
MLYVSPALSERIAVRRRGYPNLADPDAGLNAGLHQDARRFDALGLSAEATACALAALRTLERASWSAIFEHARALAAELAERLTAVGRSVGPRGATTLVSFASPDPEAERVRLTAAGVIVRDIPGTPWLRASVGAWNNQADLERLLGALGN